MYIKQKHDQRFLTDKPNHWSEATMMSFPQSNKPVVDSLSCIYYMFPRAVTIHFTIAWLQPSWGGNNNKSTWTNATRCETMACEAVNHRLVCISKSERCVFAGWQAIKRALRWANVIRRCMAVSKQSAALQNGLPHPSSISASSASLSLAPCTASEQFS